MLWFDNSNALLSIKIQKAIKYYQDKYGKEPNLVLVHPSVLEKKEILGTITVRPYRPVLPNHIWVGIEDEHIHTPTSQTQK